ncbi:glycosyltransferase family 9 protein [Catenuloplanes atrovinosus]|uniref:ADP-heptose:LPS heptosyltransferase n=1 Tax=Catenuloplanes atrovinosus TaxID=137266 RepID=A0AAE3YKY1_9ACTN|nr:glycosyltransferase family 9 protein [Catenuloplanes atrovinosus]MDR7274330.1 ADP-heptose:LPS heptosyltransferase [Catenuloplanes atrovinosus]
MILVLRALGVGDLATGVPALRALRAAFPSEELALAAPTWLTPLIDLIGGVDRVVPCAGLDDPLPPLPDVSVAVNLHGRGPQSHHRLAAVRPGALWAFATPEFPDGPPWRDDEHEVRRWTGLVRAYGVPANDLDLDLRPPARDVPHGVTIIHPGAKSPSRRWPPDRYAAVARALTDAGHRVLVTGSAAERELAADVAARAGLGAPAVPETGLDDLAALIAHARLLISGDTGVAHLATAFGTPSVTLFGPMPPSRWGPPPGRPRHRAIWHGTRAERGDLPGPGVHPALLAVTVEEVLAATHPSVSAARR